MADGNEGKPFRLAFTGAAILYFINLALGSPVTGWVAFVIPFGVLIVALSITWRPKHFWPAASSRASSTSAANCPLCGEETQQEHTHD